MNKFIGIPCWLENRGKYVSHEINNNFSKMVLDSGGIPIIIPQVYDKSFLDEYINMIDALILVGGSDISPYLYKEGPNRYLESTSPIRDEVEIYLLEKAVERKIPIFGICRGMQLINIFLVEICIRTFIPNGKMFTTIAIGKIEVLFTTMI